MLKSLTHVVAFTCVNAVLWQMFGTALDEMRGSILDPLGKYVALGVFLVGSVALFVSAAKRLRMTLLYALALVSALVNVLTEIGFEVANGMTHVVPKGAMPFSANI